jgi:hypothetical protein
MTTTVADLGEIGVTGAILTPIDLPLLRNGGTWDLSSYTNPRINVWDLRTRAAVASPTTNIEIRSPATAGVVRIELTAANYPSGTYEARITVEGPTGADETSGLFRFHIGANENP